MHPMLQKQVESGFMTEEQGNYIEEAIQKGESLIISGHRSAGVRPFMAAIMMVVKGQYSAQQVKKEEDLELEGRYLLIPGLDVDNFEDIVARGFSRPETSIVTIKEPEHPYSMMKIMKQAYKKTQDAGKVVHLLECRKIDNVPHLINFSKMSYDEKGKVLREDAE